ncbi:FAD-dependent oxidoreductase [Enorma phocaeensis]|uniref:FAD-dependent oxidoreductase n=1 Tax=Enorma phocaeensis TaxID=1871019 RepID=A0ABT7VBB4_9ACTN|nr:FAD-dependent oxidoreductase [Enorma phocaeensis]MDM8275797.1 FAD-dependent oxidoreductase [Enorma phocaeensis]
MGEHVQDDEGRRQGGGARGPAGRHGGRRRRGGRRRGEGRGQPRQGLGRGRREPARGRVPAGGLPGQARRRGGQARDGRLRRRGRRRLDRPAEGPRARAARDGRRRPPALRLRRLAEGAYRVDRHQRTSDPDVYAVGDCATIWSNALRAETYIALATSAVRSGIVEGHNVGGTPLEAIGVQGSNAISVFGLNLVSTGLSVRAAEQAGLDVAWSDFADLQRPGFMRENAEVKIRIVYEKGSRRVVGAQLASTTDVSMAIHMFSLAIEEGVSIDKLKLLDIFFLPHFNQPYNYITMCALGAE